VGYGFFLKTNSDSQCCWKKYSGGVATVYPKTISVPVLISEYHCVGNETSFSSCKGDNGVHHSAFWLTSLECESYDFTANDFNNIYGTIFYGS
jgi:hypothetical protein